MEASEVRRAVDAAGTTAAALGLDVGDAVVVHNSDRIAVRLTPCDVLARVARFSWRVGHLRERDRELVSDTLRRVSTRTSRWGSGEQLLHGEPHPENDQYPNRDYWRVEALNRLRAALDRDEQRSGAWNQPRQ
jgi:hypothetical protein